MDYQGPKRAFIGVRVLSSLYKPSNLRRFSYGFIIITIGVPHQEVRAGTSRKSEKIDLKKPKFIGPKQNPVLKETRGTR